MEDKWESMTDQDARDGADQIVKDALRVIMRGTVISPQDADCPRDRAQVAVRHIAYKLFELAEAYQLDPDLQAALFDVSHGFEPALPDDLRQYWRRNPQFPAGHEHDAPDKVQ